MGERIGQLAMSCMLAGLLMGQGVSAASLEGRFEVSKTKLLFLLGAGEFDQALAYAKRVQSEGNFDTYSSELNPSVSGLAGPIRTKVYDAEWHYWLGVSSSRNNLLPDAASNFAPLDPDLLFDLPVQFEYGVVLLRQKNYAAANSQLADWVAREPNHNQGRYYLALTFFELGDYDSASQLLTVLIDDPVVSGTARAIPTDQARYLLASSLFRDERYGDARPVIQRILNAPERSRYHDAAQDLLINITQIERANKKWGVSVSLRAAYDSNVTLNPVPFSGEGRGALQLGVYYKVLPDLIGRYSIFASRHTTNSGSDLQAHSLSLGGRLPLGALNVDAGYRLGVNLLDQTPWMTSHTLFSQWQGKSLSAQLDLTANRFEDSATEPGYSATLNSQWRLPMRLSGIVRPMLGATLGWQGNETLATETVSLGVLANIEVVLQSWRLRPEIALDNSFLASDAPVTNQLLGRATLFVDRTWSPHFNTSIKADALMSAATPSDTSYNRNIITAVLAWSF
jgi:tetratricopeptide (TPR) repeat protein